MCLDGDMKSLNVIKKYSKIVFDERIVNNTIALVKLIQYSNIDRRELRDKFNNLSLSFTDAVPVVYFNITYQSKIKANCPSDYIRNRFYRNVGHIIYETHDLKLQIDTLKTLSRAFKKAKDSIDSQCYVKYVDILGELSDLYLSVYHVNHRFYEVLHECLFDMIQCNPMYVGGFYIYIMQTLDEVFNKISPLFTVISYKNSTLLDVDCNICMNELKDNDMITLLHPHSDSNRLQNAHFMCETCIQQYNKQVCPFCRQPNEYIKQTLHEC